MSEKVNKHNVRTLGTENTQNQRKMTRNTEKVPVCCAPCVSHLFGSYYFSGFIVTGANYKLSFSIYFPRMLTSLTSDTIFQYNETPSQYNLEMRHVLDKKLPNSWV